MKRRRALASGDAIRVGALAVAGVAGAVWLFGVSPSKQCPADLGILGPTFGEDLTASFALSSALGGIPGLLIGSKLGHPLIGGVVGLVAGMALFGKPLASYPTKNPTCTKPTVTP